MGNEIRNIIPDPDGLLPPLPDSLETISYDSSPFPFPPYPPIHIYAVRCGCYLINYTPNNSPLVTYDGTLRVECHGNKRIASGDLYQRPVYFHCSKASPICFPVVTDGPNPASGIPVLARNQYRYYLQVTQILQSLSLVNSFTLGFKMWRFDKAGTDWSKGGTWTDKGEFTALVAWGSAPNGYSSDYLQGDVKDSHGKVVGRLTMGWVSEFLRKATLEIDRVSVCEAPPLNNKAKVDWKSAFNEAGWDLNLQLSDTKVPNMPKGIWNEADLHNAMLKWRASTNLEAEWHYYLLCAPQIPGVFGIMFDAYASDSNNVPREGAGIACSTVFGKEAFWGLVKNQKLGGTSLYFRTAIHEIGHALGLYHNSIDTGFMNKTVVIAQSAVPPTQFPDNVKWSFASDDQKRLCHMPDIYVRPGGLPFGTSYPSTPISPGDLIVEPSGLELHVSPLLETVPIGAPIRINLELVNKNDKVLQAPKDISLKSEFIRGKVIDPSGTTRSFLPLIRCFENEVKMIPLNPGESIRESITLLRGRQGALFPAPGVYHVVVELHWDIGVGMENAVTGETDVMITSAIDNAHARAALNVLSTPDALLTMALHGDHLPDGIKAIQNAMKNEVLKPHFAYIEARRLAEPSDNRPSDLDAFANLIDEHTVMSPAEIKRAEQLMGEVQGIKNIAGKDIANILKKKLKSINVGEDTKKKQ